MTEKLNLPNQVIDSDWKDDIDYETFGTNEQEMEYIAPDKVSKASIERIKTIDLRPRFKGRGKRIMSIASIDRLAA